MNWPRKSEEKNETIRRQHFIPKVITGINLESKRQIYYCIFVSSCHRVISMSKKSTVGELCIHIWDVLFDIQGLWMICSVQQKIIICITEMLICPGVLLIWFSVLLFIISNAPIAIRFIIVLNFHFFFLHRFAITYNLTFFKFLFFRNIEILWASHIK